MIKLPILPVFTVKEMDYLYSVICESKTETFHEEGMPFKMLTFTPFKNDLLNKVKKYQDKLDAMARLQCKREPIEKKGVEKI